jgi:hypothetical protein
MSTILAWRRNVTLLVLAMDSDYILNGATIPLGYIFDGRKTPY